MRRHAGCIPITQAFVYGFELLAGGWLQLGAASTHRLLLLLLLVQARHAAALLLLLLWMFVVGVELRHVVHAPPRHVHQLAGLQVGDRVGSAAHPLLVGCALLLLLVAGRVHIGIL